MASIQETVAQRIKDSGAVISNRVIDSLAEVEISRRTNILISAIALQEKLEKAYKSSNNPDVTTYYNEIPAKVFSENLFKKLQKMKQNLDTLKTQIEAVLASNTESDYNKLESTTKNLANAGGNQEKSSGESKSE